MGRTKKGEHGGCWRFTKPAIISLALIVIFGCANVGPSSISMGRADYNKVISKTEDEQMLLTIVKGCYGDSSSLLAVSGVAANVRFQTSAGVNVGIGPEQYYLGNLVPFSGGVAYEENPTITYAPVRGEQYLRQLMSPIPLDILVLFVRSGSSLPIYIAMLANRINDMRNPDFALPSADPDPRFQRFVELNTALDRAGLIRWVVDRRSDAPYDILISDYSPEHAEEVGEFLSLIRFPMPKDESKDIVIPVYYGVKTRGIDGVAISTRSTLDLIEILRATVEIPAEHITAGYTIDYPSPGPAGRDLRIRASKDKPEHAAVAVTHRGYWFYIDDTDVSTKQFFLAVRLLLSVSMAAGSDQSAVPVLTVPVSR